MSRSSALSRAALVMMIVAALGIAGCTNSSGPPTTTSTTTGSTPDPPAGGRPPVLLVGGTFEAISVVNNTRTYLERKGYRAYSMTLLGTPTGTAGSVQSGQAICRRIDAILAETGASQVDLAGHSQGSITGRWCIKSGGALSKVRTFVSVGGVDYGTTTANLCTGQGCTDMRHGSSFLANLNAGDDTPGDVRYFKIYSNPASGGVEGEDAPIRDGATNVSAQQLCRQSLAHADEYRSIIVESFLDNVFSGRPPTATC
jgi:triacylglycerol esterase/lipase EstA (alpha/beta hydrolase family)